MIARKTLILLIFLLYASAGMLYGQSAYVNTREGIFQLTGGPGSNERLMVDNGCMDPNLLSIAIYKDTIYYNTWAGELKRFKLGVTGTCETLIPRGFACNAMTIDKHGIIYMAAEELTRYDPYARQLTELGKMPFKSSGDMIFFNNKLLLSGWDPNDPSVTGIFEIDPANLQASSLYMKTPAFLGLLAYPVACGNSRYFGLSSPLNTYSTQMIELDLVRKQVIGTTISFPEKILDGASVTETGIENKIAITGMIKTDPGSCSNNNGSIIINASSLNAPLTYTLLNTGLNQVSGKFTGLMAGRYELRIADAAGCTKDTSITLSANIPVEGCNELLVPNAFTPNNDGKNDHFTLIIPTGFKDVSLQVFNRGGTKVYEGKGGNIDWDGQYRGIKQPVGVYVYLVSYTDLAGTRKNSKGTLALLQ